ncbi:MAG: hypothetical protein HGA44_08790, partial [Cellulomonadaceae bacterium]|nr:hypothetical protein [Cellulomonadaceae bacterium]
ICLPAHGRTYVAQRGSGAFCNGSRLGTLTPADPLRGGVARWSMQPRTRVALERRAAAAGLAGLAIGERLWSGYAYARVASGETDVLVYSRTWPWDHAPGAAIVREVGGVVRRLDGADYRPGDGRQGLVVAADDATFIRVRDGLGLLDTPGLADPS